MLLRGNGNGNNVDNNEEEPLWDYVILDEGHIVKNTKTQRAQSLFQIPSAHRIVLTGTPIQNKLKVPSSQMTFPLTFLFIFFYFH
jgi:superfamily II DNA or RNA helicase